MQPEPKALRPPQSGKRGLLVIIVLTAIFFLLLGLLLTRGNRPQPQEPQTSNEELFVVPLRLRIRTQPTVKAPVVASARHGEKLRIVEAREAWVQVRNSEGIIGWAERNGLEGVAEHQRRSQRNDAIRRMPPLDGLVTGRQSATLFAGPGVFYPIVGELPLRTKIKVYTRDHDFYAVDADGEIAYVEIESINLTAPRSVRLEVPAGDVPASTSTQPAVESLPPSLPVPPLEAGIDPDRSGVYPVVPAGGTEPSIVDRKMPRYPSAARRANVEGSVVIRAIVRKDGSVDEVEVLRDLPNGLGEAAREAVEQWRFLPARYRGEAIDVYYTVTVNFKLSER